MLLNIVLIYLLVGFVLASIPIIMDGNFDKVAKIAPDLSFGTTVVLYFVIASLIAPVLLCWDSLFALKNKLRGR